MTTENKTLADECNCPNGRAEHMPTCASLRATLADVQPGGRVRLGDGLPPLPFTHYNACGDGSEPLYTAGQMRDYARAALSAQPSPGGRRFHHVSQVAECFGMAVTPEEIGAAIASAPSSRFSAESAATAFSNVKPSPGGQGDSVTDEMVDAACRAYYDTAEAAVAVDHACMEAALIAALAARPPVYVQGSDELRARTEGERAAYMEGLEEGKKIAARQPVGEPVCFISPIDASQLRSKDKTLRWTGTYWDSPGDDAVPVYLGPPAQAVDLGQFRPFIAEARNNTYAFIETMRKAGRDSSDARKKAQLTERLLDLIDSMAVGNG